MQSSGPESVRKTSRRRGRLCDSFNVGRWERCRGGECVLRALVPVEMRESRSLRSGAAGYRNAHVRRGEWKAIGWWKPRWACVRIVVRGEAYKCGYCNASASSVGVRSRRSCREHERGGEHPVLSGHGPRSTGMMIWAVSGVVRSAHRHASRARTVKKSQPSVEHASCYGTCAGAAWSSARRALRACSFGFRSADGSCAAHAL